MSLVALGGPLVVVFAILSRPLDLVAVDHALRDLPEPLLVLVPQILHRLVRYDAHGGSRVPDAGREGLVMSPMALSLAVAAP